MDKEKIINYLKDNDLSDVEILSQQKDLAAVRFYYDFDDTELKAAEAYAKDQAGDEKDEAWFQDYYIPYLTEVAVDNVGDIIEDLMAEMKVKAQFISYEMEEDNDYSEFIAIFYNGEEDIDIEDVLVKLGI